MIWLPIVSLCLGALLAQRFKFIVLVPATLVVAIVAIGATAAQSKSASLTILIIVVASVAMQVGYFVGMLVKHGLGIVFSSRLSPFSQTSSARDSVSSRPFRASNASGQHLTGAIRGDHVINAGAGNDTIIDGSGHDIRTALRATVRSRSATTAV
jgi:hypothetical protein